tara:strand:+ start:16354 stop:16824 length:471 start_codon:yes stop_codon:yes gene_type:complete
VGAIYLNAVALITLIPSILMTLSEPMSLFFNNYFSELITKVAIISLAFLVLYFASSIANLLIRNDEIIKISSSQNDLIVFGIILILGSSIIDNLENVIKSVSQVFQYRRLTGVEAQQFNSQSKIHLYSSIFSGIATIFLSLWGITKAKYFAQKISD